jgi:hypothetical protein
VRPRPRCDQATLAHPALTGLPRHELARLISALTLPWNAQREARSYQWRGGPRRRAPGAGGPALLDLTDHILVTLLYQHLRLPQHVIARLAGTHRDTIRNAIGLTRPLLGEHQPQTTTAPQRIRTLDDLIAYATASGITLPPEIKPAC